MADAGDPIPSVEHYANGRIKFQGTLLDGEMHGAWDFYRLDGTLLRTGQFERGKQVGTWRTFDRSGRVIKETDFSKRG